jgi:hypothetical protein
MKVCTPVLQILSTKCLVNTLKCIFSPENGYQMSTNVIYCILILVRKVDLRPERVKGKDEAGLSGVTVRSDVASETFSRIHSWST